MSKIIKSIVIAVAISGLSIMESSSLSLLSTRVYAATSGPSLRSIYLSEGDNISFYEDVYSYIVDVDKDTEEVSIKARPDDTSDKVTIDGDVVTKDDNYKETIKLNKGKNKIEIRVSDSKGQNSTTYTVYVYRGGKDAVYLKDININGSTIGFGGDCNFYNIELDEGTDIVEFETVPEDGKYSITVNGRELDETNSIKLKFNGLGKYTITVGLKDLDTGRTGTYTLNLYLGIPVTPNVDDAVNSVLKPNQWIIVNGRWRYNDFNGKPLKNTWYLDSIYNSYFHFNSIGNMQTGWLNDGGNWYYLKQNGAMQTGWLYYENQWYYLDYNGVMRTGWIEDDGNWYYLKRNGAMATGWIVSKNKWYFLNTSGAMETGWLYYGKKWYFLDSEGAMQIGWTQIGQDWYFFNDDGSMKSGEWVYYEDDWYYINYVGTMRCGWLYKDDKYYYFNEDGAMNTSPKTIDGYTYNFNDDGSVNFG